MNVDNHSSIRFALDQIERTRRSGNKWGPKAIAQVVAYLTGCVLAFDLFAPSLLAPEVRHITITLGVLGIWRYSWWMGHAARSSLYHRRTYPKLAARAQDLWQGDRRVKHAHFLMSTYREHKAITDCVIDSIVHEVRHLRLPATLWLGSATEADEQVVIERLRSTASDLNLTLRIVRQNQPGKRMAIGLILRALRRSSPNPDDLITFMDGDVILGHGCIQRCFALLEADLSVRAVTTNEWALVDGPEWVRRWLSMRFAQRRLAMGSHSLSGRVLTLTGRMSVFRVSDVIDLEMIRALEADYLDHWLWGRFRLLSGDDKSTWYTLLAKGARMLYLPDADVYTVERIEGRGIERMRQNLWRWSGNMLRSGARAIALGPRRVGFFIWWCLIDQRIAIWSTLITPVLALVATLFGESGYIASSIIFVLLTRLLMSLVLYCFNHEVDIAFPFLLYANQVSGGLIKAYSLSHIADQRWVNRGNQRANAGIAGSEFIRRIMAHYVMSVYLGILVVSIVLATGFVEKPTIVNTFLFWAPH